MFRERYIETKIKPSFYKAFQWYWVKVWYSVCIPFLYFAQKSEIDLTTENQPNSSINFRPMTQLSLNCVRRCVSLLFAHAILSVTHRDQAEVKHVMRTSVIPINVSEYMYTLSTFSARNSNHHKFCSFFNISYYLDQLKFL